MRAHIWTAFTALVISSFIPHKCSASEETQCRPVVHTRGVNVFNCSGIDTDSLPDELPIEAEVLDFSNNDFTEFPEIPESPECHFSCGVANTTNHCRVAISFSHNQIDSFEPFALHQLKCLQTLDLSYNDIDADIFHPAFFEEGAYYLQQLTLRGNPLGRLPDNVITQPFMHDLRQLDLSHCQLAEMGRDSVDDFGQLQVLDLSYNQLTSIHADTFKGLRKLDVLDLTMNQLTFFSEHVFGDLANLRDLRLTGNRIKDFHSNAFYTDSGLINLDLTDNQLEAVPYSAVDKLLKLKSLNLSQNPILRVTPGKVSRVENLILDDMPQLKEIGSKDLSSFPHLVTLSVSGNQALTEFHRKALSSGASSLRHVRLEDNWLTTLDSDALPWQQLESLRLGGNPWLCDDRLRWMIEAACIKEPVICAGPDNLKGHDLKSLSPTDLKREVPIAPLAGIIVFLLAVPVVLACFIFVWKRRRFCACAKHQLKGRYVTVFSRDAEDRSEGGVDIQLKAHASRIIGVSNGTADDTRHLVRLEHNGGSSAAVDDEEEEI